MCAPHVIVKKHAHGSRTCSCHYTDELLAGINLWSHSHIIHTTGVLLLAATSAALLQSGVSFTPSAPFRRHSPRHHSATAATYLNTRLVVSKVHTLKHIHSSTHPHPQTHTHTHVQTHIYAHTRTHTCVLARTHTSSLSLSLSPTRTITYTKTHRHTQTHTHTHTHTREHMYKRVHARVHARSLSLLFFSLSPPLFLAFRLSRSLFHTQRHAGVQTRTHRHPFLSFSLSLSLAHAHTHKTSTHRYTERLTATHNRARARFFCLSPVLFCLPCISLSFSLSFFFSLFLSLSLSFSLALFLSIFLSHT